MQAVQTTSRINNVLKIVNSVSAANRIMELGGPSGPPSWGKLHNTVPVFWGIKSRLYVAPLVCMRNQMNVLDFIYLATRCVGDM